MNMTPDELITHVRRQRTDLIAAELAMDALMSVLTPEQQKKWLEALRTLQAKRTTALKSAGAGSLEISQANAAIDQRIARLTAAGTESGGG